MMPGFPQAAILMIIPIISIGVTLVLVILMLVLFARLVHAVEKIADKMQ